MQFNIKFNAYTSKNYDLFHCWYFPLEVEDILPKLATWLVKQCTPKLTHAAVFSRTLHIYVCKDKKCIETKRRRTQEYGNACGYRIQPGLN